MKVLYPQIGDCFFRPFGDSGGMNKIRSYREMRKLSLAKLADLTGISAQQLNRLEKGERRLNEDNLQTIAEALGCNLQDLMGTESKGGMCPVPVLGAVNTQLGGTVQNLPKAAQYNLSIKPPKQWENASLLGMVVEGDGHKNYPEGTELIFAEIEGKKAPLKHGQMVLAALEEKGKTTHMVASLKISRSGVALEFEGKDYRSSSHLVYLQPEKAAGFGETARGEFGGGPEPIIPLTSGNIRIQGVLLKSIKPEI